MKVYDYKDNMHIINEILNELMIERTVNETINFDEAYQNVMLKMFPCVSEQAGIIENMFADFCKEYTVKNWYESLFQTPILKLLQK